MSSSLNLSDLAEEVKRGIDIIDVISSRGIFLKRKGKSYFGLCPFHEEKTPSLCITPDRQLFHCFGCGAAGDAIGFIARLENRDRCDVIRSLGDEMGIATYRGGSPENDRLRELYAVNERAMEWFKKNLARRPDVAEYLRKRGLTDETIAAYDLGYAPTANGLRSAAKENVPKLLEVGLLGNGKWGVYDFFRDRVTIPIRDEAGRVAGFSGRSLSGQEPKYLNTRETELFKKRDLLFGLNLARRSRQVAVVEGYFDAIALHQAGVPSVALMSANASPRQVRSLSRFEAVSVVLDGDAAGQAGADSLVGELSGGDFLLQVIPPETDAADFFAGGGTAKEFAALAMSVPEFRLSRISKDKPFEAVSAEIVRELEAIADPLLRAKCVARCAETLSGDDEFLYRRYASALDSLVGKPKKRAIATAEPEPEICDPNREELVRQFEAARTRYAEALRRFLSIPLGAPEYAGAKAEVENLKKEVSSLKKQISISNF